MALSINDIQQVTLPEGVDIVSVAMPTTLRHGKVTVTTGGTRVQLAGSTTLLVSGVTVKALPSNTNLIYLGGSGVASGNGHQLEAGEEAVIVIDDLSKLWIDAAVSGEGITYIGS